MRFLTAEKDLIVNKTGIVYFYSSEQGFPISDMMFSIIKELDKKKDITCIDLSFFENLYKRFDIREIPTILLLKNGLEIKRITGIPSVNDINNILERD